MHPSALIGLLAFAAAVPALPEKRSEDVHSAASIENLKSKIKNVVILEMENRSLDNVLGGQKLKGLDNPINNGPFCNPYDLYDPSKGEVCSEAKDYDSILDDPDHSVTGNNIEFYGEFVPNNAHIASGELTPNQKGFVHEQLRQHGNDANKTNLAKQVINYYTEDEVPVLTALVQNYLTFNHWHSDVPGPTNPNRAYVLSGTSAGHGINDASFNTDVHAHKQRSIFQQLGETGHTWKNYYTNRGMIDAYFFDWTFTSGNTDKAQPLESFYADAAAGKLPEFTFIDPSCCDSGTNSMHPTGLISKGEALIKDVYDALRASPQWEETLFILTFDETGGFHDHVPPPLAVRPDNLTYTETAPNGQRYTFEFDRLGGRIPTLLISPFVAKAQVEQKGINTDGETVSYSASSILRTLGYLWDFEPFTPRVQAAASFEHLIQSTKRTDTPTELPVPKAFERKVLSRLSL
ncbi:Phosphoesterase [Penicillium alfredii]|uniref:Phosphoesterase n=1 Tax=Penicillium alfredii TaxID=1506179 RepID=A0A9W9JX26_9EURO|nr:Phosphoesterase [Penicillium alfredii]KAJ5084227.1 Phosphoesterase [Penicillium alfredii]